MGKLSYVTTFAVGALIGSAASWYFAKKKYEQVVREEINSVKEAFKRNYEVSQEEEPKSEPVINEESVEEKEVKKKYKNLTRTYMSPASNGVGDVYVISPEEFGNELEYTICGLTYFEDGILADDSGEKYDITDTIGNDALDSLGDYEEDAVHVRNERLKIDFEVLFDSKKYSEVFDERE